MSEADEALLWARGAGMPIYQHHTLAEAHRALLKEPRND